MGVDGGADAALPPALNVFVLARQYDGGWRRDRLGADRHTALGGALTAVMWVVQRGGLPHSLIP